ncbi:MAG: hypothetical protein VB119_03670 [Candidatus Metalachnospira sp.]|nr:hypothetical protein [Candidatus Metalachnospira sp.]
MAKSNVRKIEFDLGDYSETYERGTVTDLRNDLGDYSMRFSNDNDTILKRLLKLMI